MRLLLWTDGSVPIPSLLPEACLMGAYGCCQPISSLLTPEPLLPIASATRRYPNSTRQGEPSCKGSSPPYFCQSPPYFHQPFHPTGFSGQPWEYAQPLIPGWPWDRVTIWYNPKKGTRPSGAGEQMFSCPQETSRSKHSTAGSRKMHAGTVVLLEFG